MTLRQLAIEVYKSVTKNNPQYLNELFLSKKCTYNPRNVSIIERPKVNTTRFGLKSFKGYGFKIWNLLRNSSKKRHISWLNSEMSLNHGMALIVIAQYAIVTPDMSISPKKNSDLFC